MTRVLPKRGDAHMWYHGDIRVAPHGVVWVLEASPEELEEDHEWVQWAYPLDTQSAYNAFAPVVSLEEFEEISCDEDLRGLVDLISYKALEMLNANKKWSLSYHDHTHKRITRMIRSLTLLGRPELAGQIMTYAKERTCDNMDIVTHNWIHWHTAAYQ